MAITNAQNRNAQAQNGRVDIRTALFENTGRAAGDDKAVAVLQFSGGNIAGLNVGINAEFTNTAGNQVSILPAGIENGNLGCSDLCGAASSLRQI